MKRANVGNPGCHKPTMTGDGKHTSHKNGDDLGIVLYDFIWFIDVYWVYHITQHSKLFQAQMLSKYRLGLTMFNLSGWIFCSPICGPIWAHNGAQSHTCFWPVLLEPWVWLLKAENYRIWIPEWNGSPNSELVALQMPPTYGNMLQAPKNLSKNSWHQVSHSIGYESLSKSPFKSFCNWEWPPSILLHMRDRSFAVILSSQ